ncbi:MAG TPA: MotA/TolQ/ExbB proton channel family protein [Gemmataceae bacterium]|nr:MotA/TolQ/ExbB proton channel family protein [Gemmataceae bacterium]
MRFLPVGEGLRRAGLVACCLAFLLIMFCVKTPAARAQEDADKAAAEPADSAKGTEPAPAAGPRPNLFKHIVVSAGPFFGFVLLVVSIVLVALIVLLSMDLRLPVAIPPAFVDEFTETVNKRKFREAFDLARGDQSYLARVLTAGMGRLQYGIEDARETAYHTVDSVKASKEQMITYLATIGSLGPMIGLVGTVYGMILSFMVLAQPGKTPNPQDLANGISHALVITLLGVALAIPAIFCHALFKNRLTRITMDTASVADDLLTQMYHNSKRPASPSTEARIPTSTAVKPAEG